MIARTAGKRYRETIPKCGFVVRWWKLNILWQVEGFMETQMEEDSERWFFTAFYCGGKSCQRMNRYRCEEWSTVIDKAYRQGTWWLWWRILQMYQEILWVGIFNVTWLYCNVQYSPCGSCTRNVQASRHQSFHLLPHLRDRCQFPPHYLLSSLRTPF